jgi:hypothetical protein
VRLSQEGKTRVDGRSILRELVQRSAGTPRYFWGCPCVLDGSRTSGERRAVIIVGEAIRGAACNAIQAAVP